MNQLVASSAVTRTLRAHPDVFVNNHTVGTVRYDYSFIVDTIILDISTLSVTLRKPFDKLAMSQIKLLFDALLTRSKWLQKAVCPLPISKSDAIPCGMTEVASRSLHVHS